MSSKSNPPPNWQDNTQLPDNSLQQSNLNQIEVTYRLTADVTFGITFVWD